MSDYFGQQIEQGKPIFPPTPAQAPSVAKAEETNHVNEPGDHIQQTSEFVGLPVRAIGDRIFLLKGGKRFWITSPEVYNKLGFKFGDEAKIDQATLEALEEGEPIR